MVYWYEVDRKEQCENTRSPLTIEEFLSYAESNKLSIPGYFMARLKEASK
jgi:hypothetical protein